MKNTVKYKTYKNFSSALKSFQKNNALVHWWADEHFYYITFREMR